MEWLVLMLVEKNRNYSANVRAISRNSLI